MEAVKLRAQEESKMVRSTAEKPLDVSIVIPVCEHSGDIAEIYGEYHKELVERGYACEFIFVIDESDPSALRAYKRLKELNSAIRIVNLNRSFGEAAALAFGFEKARAPVILTLPAYFQVQSGEIHALIQTLSRFEADLVISRRSPRKESRFGQLRSHVFHRLVRALTGTGYQDLACGVRAMKRQVAEEVTLYGDLHYFFPILAHQRGFRVVEITVQPSHHDTGRRLFRPASYLRRALDLLNLFFLVKFTRKPLRFFGSIGAVLLMMGTLITAYLGAYRLLSIGGISNRPLLVLGVLLMVVGVQSFSIGLLGELIIFTHAREVKEYQINEVL